jgi:tRNA modification GTPase
MFDTDDTIVAIATPAGRGALGVVRISGPRAPDLAQVLTTRRSALEPRRATLTRIRDASGASAVDRVVVTYFPAPHS